MLSSLRAKTGVHSQCGGGLKIFGVRILFVVVVIKVFFQFVVKRVHWVAPVNGVVIQKPLPQEVSSHAQQAHFRHEAVVVLLRCLRSSRFLCRLGRRHKSVVNPLSKVCEFVV